MNQVLQDGATVPEATRRMTYALGDWVGVALTLILYVSLVWFFDHPFGRRHMLLILLLLVARDLVNRSVALSLFRAHDTLTDLGRCQWSLLTACTGLVMTMSYLLCGALLASNYRACFMDVAREGAAITILYIALYADYRSLRPVGSGLCSVACIVVSLAPGRELDSTLCFTAGGLFAFGIIRALSKKDPLILSRTEELTFSVANAGIIFSLAAIIDYVKG